MNKKVKEYEMLIILPPSNDEASAEKKVKEIETSVLKRFDAKVLNIKNIGKKPLAYEIQETGSSFQVQVQLKAPTSSITEIREKLALESGILRYEIYTPTVAKV